MNRPAFQQRRAVGNLTENKIAQWFIRRYNALVLPIYDMEIEHGKPARIFSVQRQWVSPDLLVIQKNKVFWVEAKHKTVFSWHRITNQWVTGIDLNHYEQYKAIAPKLPGKLVILFLHQSDRILGRTEPYPCPVGLFGETLDYLMQHESHRSTQWGKHGMVYWSHNVLKQYATLPEVNACSSPRIPAGA